MNDEPGWKRWSPEQRERFESFVKRICEWDLQEQLKPNPQDCPSPEELFDEFMQQRDSQ